MILCVCWSLSFALVFFFFFKQKTAYEMRISDWSSDVCSSDLRDFREARRAQPYPGRCGVARVVADRSCGADFALSLRMLSVPAPHAASAPAPNAAPAA